MSFSVSWEWQGDQFARLLDSDLLPLPLHLQFHGNFSGRTVASGDWVGQFKIIVINQDSTTGGVDQMANRQQAAPSDVNTQAKHSDYQLGGSVRPKLKRRTSLSPRWLQAETCATEGSTDDKDIQVVQVTSTANNATFPDNGGWPVPSGDRTRHWDPASKGTFLQSGYDHRFLPWALDISHDFSTWTLVERQRLKVWDGVLAAAVAAFDEGRV